MTAQVLGVGLTGTDLTDLERRIFRETTPYAVVLFGRNVASPEQLKRLVSEVKEGSAKPPLILVDEEGGRVDRLRNIVPGFPSAEAFGEGERAEELARWAGAVIGKTLRWFGIDVNLAPVVDLKRTVAARGLERRCFGADAATVIKLAGAFIDGQQGQGVASCLKHFPGIGAGSADTHYGQSVVPLAREVLIEEDLAPYRVLGDRVGSVMIGHARYPSLESPPVPATLSREISTLFLRKVAGFKGLALSDDVEMHAVSDLGSDLEIAAGALKAGSDLILYCSQIEKVPQLIEDLTERAAADRDLSSRIDEALVRGGHFRSHCEALQKRSLPVESFDALIGEVDEFCRAFSAAHPPGSVPADGDRRERQRNDGTGKTDRQEWT